MLFYSRHVIYIYINISIILFYSFSLQLSAKDRASISRLVSGLDDDDDEDQPPRGGFRPSRSSDSDRRDWDSNRDGYSWSQRRENKPAPPLPPPPPRAQDQSLFKRKNEIELSAQHEMEELFQKRPPKR